MHSVIRVELIKLVDSIEVFDFGKYGSNSFSPSEAFGDLMCLSLMYLLIGSWDVQFSELGLSIRV